MTRPECDSPSLFPARHALSVLLAEAEVRTERLNAINDLDGLSHCPMPSDWDDGTVGLEGGWLCALPSGWYDVTRR
jgi:hypothetical protein